MYVLCVYIHMYVCICACGCKCVSRPEVEIECFPQSVSILLVELGHLAEPDTPFPRVWLPSLLEGSVSLLLGLQWVSSPPSS